MTDQTYPTSDHPGAHQSDLPAGLVLHLAAPLQAWGGVAAYETSRPTLPHPSKSGLVGLFACALGRDRDTLPADLAALHVAVRIDDPGLIITDYHAVGGASAGGGVLTASGATRREAIVTRRQYLSGARFTVIVEGDFDVLDTLAAALDAPRWPLFLGRRSCPPQTPPLLTSGIGCGLALRTAPLPSGAPRNRVRVVWDLGCSGAAGHPDLLPDLPMSYAPRRRAQGIRQVLVEDIPVDGPQRPLATSHESEALEHLETLRAHFEEGPRRT